MNILPKNLFALDLGTTKFCLGALCKAPDGSCSVRTISVPAKGMRRGMLVDFSKAAEALTSLLEISEKQLDCDITKVVVGIAGGHLKNGTVRATLKIETGVINSDTLKSLSTLAETKAQKEDQEILHTIVTSYQIDTRPKTENPLGFSGQYLNGDFFVVYGDKLYLKDVVTLCNQCGLQVENLYSEPVASATVTIDDISKELGVALADMGGGTTDILVFQNGKPHNLVTVNVAGIVMTNDLAIGLNLGLDEAERVKLFFGLRPNDTSKTISVKTVSGVEQNLSWREVYRILGPRIQEFGYMLGKSLIPYKGLLGHGIILTGGSSELFGLDSFLKQQLKIPVAKSYPTFSHRELKNDPFNEDEESSVAYSPKFATVLGLLNLEISRIKEQESHQSASMPARYINRFINWIKELS